LLKITQKIMNHCQFLLKAIKDAVSFTRMLLVVHMCMRVSRVVGETARSNCITILCVMSTVRLIKFSRPTNLGASTFAGNFLFRTLLISCDLLDHASRVRPLRGARRAGFAAAGRSSALRGMNLVIAVICGGVMV